MRFILYESVTEELVMDIGQGMHGTRTCHRESIAGTAGNGMPEQEIGDRPTFYDGLLEIVMPSALDTNLSKHPVEPLNRGHAEDPFIRAQLRVRSRSEERR